MNFCLSNRDYYLLLVRWLSPYWLCINMHVYLFLYADNKVIMLISFRLGRSQLQLHHTNILKACQKKFCGFLFFSVNYTVCYIHVAKHYFSKKHLASENSKNYNWYIMLPDYTEMVNSAPPSKPLVWSVSLISKETDNTLLLGPMGLVS